MRSPKRTLSVVLAVLLAVALTVGLAYKQLSGEGFG
jgi:hypothetical protein